MNLNNYSNENKPRERLIENGAESLSNYELLALILRTGTKEMNVLELSNYLLGKYRLTELSKLSIQELTKEKGIGKAKACEIIAISELVKRHNIDLIKEDTEINKPEYIAKIYQEKLKDKNQEHVYAVYLNTKNKIIAEKLLFIGTIDNSVIHPREIYKEAVKNSAVYIILIHNHPSGDTTPSQSDIDFTQKLKESSKVMDIDLLDHIIVGNDYFSFKENRII